ncbi:MAG TPA: hypothetical protein VNA69_02740 [Thermoanaerobaculia bacterium]|nr:hypothetical protein [Thermoanaerobaculia bacterium]
MTRRFLIITFAVLAAFACATGDRADKDEEEEDAVEVQAMRYSASPGRTPVGVIPSASLRDAKRERDVSLTIDYPTRGGPHPLIVFSHGAGANGRAYVGLSSHWASHGYVVIKPTHPDNVRLADLAASDFRERVGDITFVLDSLDALETKYPELKGKIDRARIGVGGHSLGAMTAIQLAGARTFHPAPVSYADPRVKAVIAMSPQGPREEWGLTRESWAEIKTPVMFMTGDRDAGMEGEKPEWRREPFELSAAGDKWLVYIPGAGHFAFAGRTGITQEEATRPTHSAIDDPSNNPLSPRRMDPNRVPRGNMVDDLRSITGAVRALSLAFWDAYLRGEAKGTEHLEKSKDRGDLEVKRK